jgi:hypothetical protein
MQFRVPRLHETESNISTVGRERDLPLQFPNLKIFDFQMEDLFCFLPIEIYVIAVLIRPENIKLYRKSTLPFRHHINGKGIPSPRSPFLKKVHGLSVFSAPD